MTDNRTDSQQPEPKTPLADAATNDTKPDDKALIKQTNPALNDKDETGNGQTNAKNELSSSSQSAPSAQTQDRVATSQTAEPTAKASGTAKTNDNSKSNPMTNHKPVNKTAKPENKKPEIEKINIVIAGASYPIFCPADEVDELREAEKFIDDFATAIKKDAPKLNQENLLVLSCLNLFEKINSYKKLAAERQQQDKAAENLVNKIMQEAQSVL